MTTGSCVPEPRACREAHRFARDEKAEQRRKLAQSAGGEDAHVHVGITRVDQSKEALLPP